MMLNIVDMGEDLEENRAKLPLMCRGHGTITNCTHTGVGSTLSSYLATSTPSFTSFYHKDRPALMVLISFLNMLDAPLWQQVNQATSTKGFMG